MHNAPYPQPEESLAPLTDDHRDAGRRRRPKPGERRDQILHALAGMLEQPGGERVTTAGLAARLGVSEAALYRHFASKAQMFEGLIDFIEQTIFSLINQIVQVPALPDSAIVGNLGVTQAKRIVEVVIEFAERNPGLARVMVGDALVLEHERLQQRMNQFIDKVEAALKQSLRGGGGETPTVDAQLCASILSAFIVGRMQRFVRSGYRRSPSEHLDAAVRKILG